MKRLLIGSLLSCMVVGQVFSFAALRQRLMNPSNGLAALRAQGASAQTSALLATRALSLSSCDGKQKQGQYQGQEDSSNGARDQEKPSWWNRVRNFFGFAAVYTAYQAHDAKNIFGLKSVYADEKDEDETGIKLVDTLMSTDPGSSSGSAAIRQITYFMNRDSSNVFKIAYQVSTRDKFTPLANSLSGLHFLRDIMSRDETIGHPFRDSMGLGKSSPHLFAQAASDNFVFLARELVGNALLRDIISRDSSTASTFTQPAADNLESLTTNMDEQPSYIVYLLNDIMESDPLAAHIFAQQSVKIFRPLAASTRGRDFLCKIMEIDSSAAHMFAQQSADDLEFLTADWSRRTFLGDIMKLDPLAAPMFAQQAIDNFSSLMKTLDGLEYLCDLVEGAPEFGSKFAQQAGDSIAFLTRNFYGPELLEKITLSLTEWLNGLSAQAEHDAREKFASSYNTHNGFKTFVDYASEQAHVNYKHEQSELFAKIKSAAHFQREAAERNPHARIQE